jgi:hypothetical protein
MRTNWITRFGLVWIVMLSLSSAIALGHRNGTQTEQKTKGRRNTTGLSLDIIVGGPFAFVEAQSCAPSSQPCLEVWAPAVAGHTGIIGFGGSGELKQFTGGDYDFTVGVHPAGSTGVDAPVVGASILTVSAASAHLPPTPSSPYATIKLPMPREIVPWNADPMQIASTTPVPSTTTPQTLATLTVLRYDFQDSNMLEVDDASGAFWKPHPFPSGNERVLLIGIIPQDPAVGEDQHVHATEAFNSMMTMVGLTRFANFIDPPTGFQRNRPLNSASPLPPDLQNIIDSLATGTSMNRNSLSKMDVGILGRINDCKAPALLVTP